MAHIYSNYTSTSVNAEQNFSQKEDLFRKKLVFNSHISPSFLEWSNRSVLDVGCGYGAYINLIKEAGAECQGVDISDEQCETGRRLFPGIEIVGGDALSFLKTKAPGSFDCILLMDVLEHLEIDYAVKVVTEARRILKENGVIIAMAPNLLAPFCPTLAGDVTHLRGFSPKSLRQLFLLAGFTSVSVVGQKWTPQSALGLARAGLWVGVVEPFLCALNVILYGTKNGGIFRANLVASARNEQD